MNIGLIIYGSLDTLSGGYLYDRKLVEYLRAHGDTVEIISLPWRNYIAHLSDNFTFRLPRGLDLVIEDELNHPSLLAANGRPHPYPIISLVHHLRCSELRPQWQNDFYRVIEQRYLESVDGFIFNSQTTQGVVNRLVESSIPSMIAYPPTDRFGAALSQDEVIARAQQSPLKILFLGNVIERKGLHTVLEALGGVGVGRNNISSCQLDVVGSLTTDPEYVQAMRNKVAAKGLSSAVTFHGALDGDALREKPKAAHVLVVPSSYEGFGIVYLEGMGFGLPAIGTTAGAASEIIAHGETGYLIAPGDSRSLTNHLITLAEDRNLLTQLALNALRRYQQQPKWKETAGNIRKFLFKISSGDVHEK